MKIETYFVISEMGPHTRGMGGKVRKCLPRRNGAEEVGVEEADFDGADVN